KQCVRAAKLAGDVAGFEQAPDRAAGFFIDARGRGAGSAVLEQAKDDAWCGAGFGLILREVELKGHCGFLCLKTRLRHREPLHLRKIESRQGFNRKPQSLLDCPDRCCISSTAIWRVSSPGAFS